MEINRTTAIATTKFSLTNAVHRHLLVVMPTLRAGDERALGTPAGRNRKDTNKDMKKSLTPYSDANCFRNIDVASEGFSLADALGGK